MMARAAALCVACFLLCADRPVAAQPASRPASRPAVWKGARLSLRVVARYKKERRGDGAPSLHFRYILHNRTDRPIHLNYYGRVRVVGLSPRRAFRVRRIPRRPHRVRHPGRSDILVIPPRSKKVIKDWQWCCGFELPHADPRYLSGYTPRRTRWVTLRFCYHGAHNPRLARFLPAGQTFWLGRLCNTARVKLHAKGR